MHTGAVTADGRLYTWGRGDNGQLGVGRLAWEEEEDMGGVYGGCVGLSAPALVDPACFESPVKQVGLGVVDGGGCVYHRVWVWLYGVSWLIPLHAHGQWHHQPKPTIPT